MRYIIDFGKFWYDFIIGDDWTIAVAIGVILVILRLAYQPTLWWVLPIVVILALGASLWRATRVAE